MSTNTKAISDDILKAAWDAAGHVYSPDDSPSSHSYVRDIIAKAIHDAVMAERRRCEVAVAMACRVGKHTPLSEYIAAIRATPKAEG